ncbi:hypothetical protein L1987_12031 [Smallanthus sonchifolius]|uniref:Uncharacterized protein n=1 Tax=Smallanthus sonchifolius TaxID=185202 RepID=A0ACB9JCN3_9ASTR|nr:hypothetical protein L1987_12031 [Smallanthus sonchifolius]
MGKSPSSELGLKKGPWTSEEDQKLIGYIEEHGHGSWRTLSVKAAPLADVTSPETAGVLSRDVGSWRRIVHFADIWLLFNAPRYWQNVPLVPTCAIWSAIATHLPRRTDNEIKNYWNTHLQKRLTKMGIDPVTHKPRIAIATNLTHMTQWEITRLEAEARLCHKPRLIPESYQQVQSSSTPHVNESNVQCFSQPKPQCLDVLQAWKNSTLSKQSYFKGPQTPTSSLSFFENALLSLSTIQNRSMLETNPTKITKPSLVMNMNTNGCMSDMEILKEPFNILDVSNEEHVLEVSDILDQDYYAMEALTCGDTNNYWNRILDNLENISSHSSAF